MIENVKLLTREEIEQMRGWIRLYYIRAGHEASAHLSDSLCDMALSALAHQRGVVVPEEPTHDIADYKAKYPDWPTLLSYVFRVEQHAIAAEAKLRQAFEEAAKVKADYSELIMWVSRKHPGETRHQTALRYIQQAEQPRDGQADAKSALAAGKEKEC